MTGDGVSLSELAAIVQAQAAEIEGLKARAAQAEQRLDALEGGAAAGSVFEEGVYEPGVYV